MRGVQNIIICCGSSSTVVVIYIHYILYYKYNTRTRVMSISSTTPTKCACACVCDNIRIYRNRGGTIFNYVILLRGLVVIAPRHDVKYPPACSSV